jgi:hypothetical protein
MKSELNAAVIEVQELIKAGIRAESLIPFHRASLFLRLPANLNERLGESDNEKVRAVANIAARLVEEECSGMKVLIRENLYGVDLSIVGSAEWTDALRYAHGTGELDAARKLSPAAAELLERIDSGELSSQFRSELSVRHRISYFGWSSDFGRLVEELKEKGIRFKRLI